MVEKEKNVLIVNEGGISNSGAEIRIRILLQYLIEQKYKGTICILSHTSATIPHKMKKYFIRRGVSFYSTTHESYNKTKEIIQKKGIDIVQCHNLGIFNADPIRAAKDEQKKVIWFAHDYWVFCGNRNLYAYDESVCTSTGPKCIRCIGLRAILHLRKIQDLINKVDIAIAPSKIVKQMYENHSIAIGKWKIIHPWISSKFKSRSVTKREGVLFVGPLSKAKGIFLALEAFNIVAKHNVRLKLRIVGSGQEKESIDRQEVESYIRKNYLQDQVEYGGYKSVLELRDEFNRAEVYMCTPLWPELFGQTWAQAVACQCNVVATNVGSIPELSKRKIFLANPSPDSVSKALRTALSMRQLSQKLSRELTREMNIKYAAKQILELYKE